MYIYICTCIGMYHLAPLGKDAANSKSTFRMATHLLQGPSYRQVRQVGTSHGLCPRDNEEVRTGGCVPCRDLSRESGGDFLRKHPRIQMWLWHQSREAKHLVFTR